MTEHTPVLATHRSRSTGEGSAQQTVIQASNSAWRKLARLTRRGSVTLVALGVLTQVGYPLLAGDALRIATVFSVFLLSGACVLHAGTAWGARGALGLLVIAGGLGLAAETVGVHTGYPFGEYVYSNSLGPQLAGVPIIVPLAWTMLAYPCLLLGRRHAQRGITAGSLASSGTRVRWVTALAGGIGLAGWDLFLDPQMVAQGHWSWAYPTPALPGVPGVPLTNYAGWLLVSVLMIAAMDRLLPVGSPAGEFAPATVLAWTWLGSAVGNLAFFDRPWVALYGGVVMGAVTLPYLLDRLRPAGARPRPGKFEPGKFGPERFDNSAAVIMRAGPERTRETT